MKRQGTFIISLLLAFIIFLPLSIHAESEKAITPPFGLAMVGAPKYSARDTHLDYANPNAPKGGTLKQAVIGSFDTLNQFSLKGKAPPILDLTTARLMSRVWDEPFTLYPMIAARADVPEDRSSITFTLDPRAIFHDGSPITADDVLFSFETLREKGRPNMRRIYQLATPEILSPHKIKFTFGNGYDRETMMIFAMMPVLSKTYWQDKDFAATTLTPPLGSGPYKIETVDPGRKITLKRVENYWAENHLTNKGHYNFDRIIHKYYRDGTAAFEAFKAGNLNLRREWDSGLWHSGYDFPAAADGRVIKETLRHHRPDKVRSFIFNTRRTIFQDIHVREALSLLFDFDWVNKNLFYGAYKEIDSFFPNTPLAANSENKTLPPRKQTMREKMRRADQLLKEAGWIIKDGVRVHVKTGTPLTFEILLNNASQEKIALSFAQNLKKMGIAPQIRVLDSAAFREQLNNYDFDMALYYWLSTLSPGTEQYLYWSCESAQTPGRWNYAGICEDKIDALAQKIPTAKTRDELVKSVHALDRALMAGHYMIPLYYNPSDNIAHWSNLKHPANTPLYGTVLETWWME